MRAENIVRAWHVISFSGRPLKLIVRQHVLIRSAMKTYYELAQRRSRIYRFIMVGGGVAVIAVAAATWDTTTVLGVSRRAFWTLPVALCLLLAEAYLAVSAIRTCVTFGKDGYILRHERHGPFRWNVIVHSTIAAVMATCLGIVIPRLLAGVHVV